MNVLVTGVGGQLGHDVIKELNKRGITSVGADITEFDITDINSCKSFFSTSKPTHLIHCAAYTAVDKAEDEQELCENVNAGGTKNLALICKGLDIPMMYISTDYVFDGKGDRPFEVTDKPNPLGVYGKTKLMGEQHVKDILTKFFIIRISWVFGLNGNNFVKTMLRLGKEREEINVVDDQIGSPTNTADLAVLLCDMIVTQKYGTYHATNEGFCSWADFTREIFKIAGYNTKVNKITTDQYPTKAPRPKNSRLSKESLDAAGFKRLPGWQESIKEYLKHMS